MGIYFMYTLVTTTWRNSIGSKSFHNTCTISYKPSNILVVYFALIIVTHHCINKKHLQWVELK